VQFESLHVLADVTLAQPPPPPTSTSATPLKTQGPIKYQRRHPRSYTGKKSQGSVNALDLAADSGMLLSEPAADVLETTTPSDNIADTHSADVDMSGVAVEKVTDTSIESFFVASKEYVVSPRPDTVVQEHITDGDASATPSTRGSADITIDSAIQDFTADPMEESDIPKDDSADITRVFDDDLVSEQEKLEQERLRKECADKKKSSDFAQELQAKYDSEIQSATIKYVSTLPLARQRELDAAVPNFAEADWMHIGQ
jgi:hypothetical protein